MLGPRLDRRSLDVRDPGDDDARSAPPTGRLIEGWWCVLGDDVHRIADSLVPLHMVLPGAVVAELWERLEESMPGRPVARGLARFVARRVGGDWSPDPVPVDAVALLRASRPLDLRGLSERQFRRRFVRNVGYGPAFYRRIVRLDHATDLFRRHPGRTMAQLAAQAGYADESHLWRDAVELTGSTPGRLRLG